MSQAEFHVSSASVAVVTRALEQVDTQLKNEAQAELRALGAMVERDVETLARIRIRNTTRTPVGGDIHPWSAMRSVAKQNVVYVAPMNRGTHGRGPKHRGRFDDLMWERAMYPTIRRHEANVYRRFQALTEKVCGRFNRA